MAIAASGGEISDMSNFRQFAGTQTLRGLPLLLLAYAGLMTDYIFGRAFRDSLLGSYLTIHSLPWLTMWSTLVSIVASLVVSNLFRSEKRRHIACAAFAVHVVIELLFAFAPQSFPWLYGLFFIDVSASTLIGLSMIWILVGDWASSCHADRSRLIPAVLLFGTAVGILAGVGLTHLRTATSFRSANLILAAMNSIPAVALLFHSDEFCVPRHGFTLQDLQDRAYLPSGLLRKFAVLVVIAAMTSTLLDLMFRIRVAEHYLNQADRLHFLGLFQSSLNICAFLSQIAVGHIVQRRLISTFIHLHPAIIAVASCLFVFVPGFWQFTCLRTGEYSLRNSLFRLGSEMTYACFPDEKRATVRPLIDVIGERLGDLCASGILALLLLMNPRLPVKPGLLVLTLCSLLFWWVCRTLERSINAVGVRSGQDLAVTAARKYSGMAHEGAGIV
jgi:ATP/ADP translocase